MKERIGFYICHCGTNIAGKVRVDEVSRFASSLEGVVVSRDYKFMCSDPGQEMIQRDIRDMGLNRVVVASCSPRLHERTFQGALERAGLNPYLFQMSCIREHCSWVIEDADEATSKAKALVAAAIRRVSRHEKLQRRRVKVHPDVLVVGAGISGIQASLEIAASGHRVYLVEREPSIGGHMVKFDKTFPTLDCAACISTPKTVSVSQSENITLLTYSEVSEVSGFVGNFKVKVKRKPRYVREDRCTGCGECAKVCPVAVTNEFDEGLSERRAIYRFFPQAVPVAYCIEKGDRAPCQGACPAGVNIQGYIQLIGAGKYREAVSLIMEKIPLPGVLGRVCPHPCESACRRAEVDQGLAIRDLKRFACDRVDYGELPLPEIEERNERVAVIGSGPSGLTVAWDLRLKGFQVTLFEALPVLGGMLRVGIPDYRLPPSVLDREIENILKLGIEVRTGKRLGVDFTLEDLWREGFKAIFLGIGAHLGVSLNIEGESSTRDALSFLREVNLGGREAPGKRVVIVGGGNVAIDAARSALRLGCEEVSIVYRRSEEEMPAYPEEREGALREGVSIYYLTAPVRVLSQGGKVSGLECIRTRLSEPDESKRRRPVPIEGSEFVIPCDAVIPAVGQRCDSSTLMALGLGVTRGGTLSVSPKTLETSIPGVFSAGDLVSGPATVIDAIASGHRAAEAIEGYILRGRAEPRDDEPSGRERLWRPIPGGIKKEERAQAVEREEAVVSSFDEVSLGLSAEEGLREASRCLNCGICSECMECVRACERGAIDHTMEAEELELEVGAIVLATGFDLMDPTPLKQFGYGRFPEVYTGLQFERLNNATGPTGGRILTRDGRVPESIGIIHCVGSRDTNHHPYCSRVCCMYALKYGHLIKEKVGHETKVYNFYIDMRCFGKGYEEFYRRLQEEGITFIRGRPAEVVEDGKKLVIISEDTLLSRKLELPVDMVILCSAVEPRADAPEVARTFGISQGGDGFFLEEHPKLGPTTTATDGIFLAGACQGPKDIPDSVSHASGAAVKALSLVSFGRVEISPVTSWIDPEVCSGCRTCIGLCAYSAIEFDARHGISVVNEAMCKGCGSCAGACPSGAARVKHFTAREVFSEIEGMLDAMEGG